MGKACILYNPNIRQVREETDSDPQNSVILDEISITDQIIKGMCLLFMFKCC